MSQETLKSSVTLTICRGGVINLQRLVARRKHRPHHRLVWAAVHRNIKFTRSPRFSDHIGSNGVNNVASCWARLCLTCQQLFVLEGIDKYLVRSDKMWRHWTQARQKVLPSCWESDQCFRDLRGTYEMVKYERNRLRLCRDGCIHVCVRQMDVRGSFQVRWCVISWQSARSVPGLNTLWPPASSAWLFSSRLFSASIFLLCWSELEPVILHWAHFSLQGLWKRRGIIKYPEASERSRNLFFIFPQTSFCCRAAALKCVENSRGVGRFFSGATWRVDRRVQRECFHPHLYL